MTTDEPGAACPACGGPVSRSISSTDRNRGAGGAEFHYGSCRRCGLVELLDPPEDLAAFYDEGYYRQPPLAELRRTAGREAYQLGLLSRHARTGRLVEIGPAWGVFSLQAKEAGYDVTAIEMDAACCDYLSTVVGVEAINSDRPEVVLPQLGSVDVVAMWQVLEHLNDPWTVLTASADALVEGGHLVVATPNPISTGFRLMRSRWPHLDAPRHLWLFPPDVLRNRVRGLGLELVELSYDDPGARSWNRFAWQRLLMNEVHGRNAQRAMFVLGAALALVAAPFERGHRASSYTAIFRKGPRP
jgi:hypothetical protein